MMNILGVVEDIPIEVMREGVQWEVGGVPWESFPQWLDALDQLPLAIDIAAMVAHSAVRPFVLGIDRCNLGDRKGGPADNPLTQVEKQAIADCVQEAVAAGAVGFSTSRFTGHRDSEGRLAPGSLADTDELILIAKAVAEVGGCTIEMVNDFSSYDDIPLNKLDPERRQEHFDRELGWIEFVAREYGLPVNWLDGVGNTPKSSHPCWRQWAEEGLPIDRQVIVRPQALIFSWRSRMHPFVACSTFKRIREEVASPDSWAEHLAKPHVREAIISEYYEMMEEDDDSAVARIQRRSWAPNSKRWARLYPMVHGFDYDPPSKKSAQALAAAGQQPIIEFVYSHMMTNNCCGTIWEGGYADMTRLYDHLYRNMMDPQVLPGVSDAGAHLNLFQDGTSPTNMLSYWARDRVRGPQMTIEHAVQKQARNTAYRYASSVIVVTGDNTAQQRGPTCAWCST